MERWDNLLCFFFFFSNIHLFLYLFCSCWACKLFPGTVRQHIASCPHTALLISIQLLGLSVWEACEGHSWAALHSPSCAFPWGWAFPLSAQSISALISLQRWWPGTCRAGGEVGTSSLCEAAPACWVCWVHWMKSFIWFLRESRKILSFCPEWDCSPVQGEITNTKA